METVVAPRSPWRPPQAARARQKPAQAAVAPRPLVVPTVTGLRTLDAPLSGESESTQRPATAFGSPYVPDISRRSLLRLTVPALAVAATPAVNGTRGPNSVRKPGTSAGPPVDTGVTYRAAYHFTVPDGWKNDPQRPFFQGGLYYYYYLYNADHLSGGEGTAWRLATTRDNVVFEDQGVAIPKFTQPNGDVWSGAAVVDTEDTAGFGADSVIALVTQGDHQHDGAQAQFLWVSQDGGRSFQAQGSEPVLPNPGVEDFRDPKVVRDEERARWVMLLAEGAKVGFYVSEDLRSWRYRSGFSAEGYGVLECPDLFQLATEEGERKWVLGVSANGTRVGLPSTYAYWPGEFDGDSFAADFAEPEWLDHGFDWYGAVTWGKYDSTGRLDPQVRYAIAWLNHWDYPDNTPTVAADGFNGTDSIVRELSLVRDEPSARHLLRSRPVPALDDLVSQERSLDSVRVAGERQLPFRGDAFELWTTMNWQRVKTAGLRLRESEDRSRHVDVGIHTEGDPYVFVNRGGTYHPDQSGSRVESQTPLHAEDRRVHLRILVDRTSIEVFVDEGRYVHSSQIFPAPDDIGVTLFADGGTVTFSELRVREFRPLR